MSKNSNPIDRNRKLKFKFHQKLNLPFDVDKFTYREMLGIHIKFHPGCYFYFDSKK